MGTERIVLLTGPTAGASFELGQPVSIGRNPDNVIQLDDLQVSRKHAVIERGAMGVMLRDLGSGNGTFVGDRRILEYLLADGDVVRIGVQELRYEAGDSGAAKAAAQPPTGARIAEQEDEIQSSSTASKDGFYQTFFAVGPSTAGAQDQLKQTQKRLQAVYQANELISSERDLNKLFVRVMEQIFNLVPAHNGCILLKENEQSEWVQEHTRTGLQTGEFIISSTIINRVYQNKEAMLTSNAAIDSRFDAGASIIAQNITSALCAPLLYQDTPLGVIYVDTRGTSNAFAQGDLDLLMGLAGPAAIAIKNAQYLSQIEKSYQDTLIVLANAIELRDHYTVGHTWRVTRISMEMARAMNWTEEKLKELEMGAVLHDVGKIAVDNNILGKPGRLTDEEYDILKVHPQRGADLMKDIVFLHPLIPYCLYHHERYDGKGYPFGMSGEDIPVEGRIVAVADTFDAMTSNRPYRKGLDPKIALEELEKGKGTQFDPVCAQALIDCYHNGMIDQIMQDYYSKDERSIACPFCSTFLRVPETTQIGENFSCHVCRRVIHLKEENGAYYGEMIPQSDAVVAPGAGV